MAKGQAFGKGVLDLSSGTPASEIGLGLGLPSPQAALGLSLCMAVEILLRRKLPCSVINVDSVEFRSTLCVW